MSTEQEQDLQEFIDLRARIKELELEKKILERTIELLTTAGHMTEEHVEKARKLATNLTTILGTRCPHG